MAWRRPAWPSNGDGGASSGVGILATRWKVYRASYRGARPRTAAQQSWRRQSTAYAPRTLLTTKARSTHRNGPRDRCSFEGRPGVVARFRWGAPLRRAPRERAGEDRHRVEAALRISVRDRMVPQGEDRRRARGRFRRFVSRETISRMPTRSLSRGAAAFAGSAVVKRSGGLARPARGRGARRIGVSVLTSLRAAPRVRTPQASAPQRPSIPAAGSPHCFARNNFAGVRGRPASQDGPPQDCRLRGSRTPGTHPIAPHPTGW